MTDSRNPALLHEPLYSKSQTYIARGFRAQDSGDNEEYQLWASLSLELLGKAALAKVHPALVADPNHYQSLFAACGRHISQDIKTITAKTLFGRLGHLDKAFDKRHQKFCEQISLRRNAELHSGETPFTGMLADHWEREYWSAAQCILNIQKENLSSWLGAEQSKAPLEVVRKAREAIEWAAKDRIKRFEEMFRKSHQDPSKFNEALEYSEQFQSDNYSKYFKTDPDESETHNCPACECFGFLLGSLWDEEITESDPDNYDYPPTEIVTTTYVSDEFYCPTCKLSLFGSEELSAGHLPLEFQKEEEREREFEPDYGND